MLEQNIPTAAYREFNVNTLKEGLEYISQQQPPIVLKADGLAAGKGVLILNDVEEAKLEFTEMLSGKFGEAVQELSLKSF